MHIQARRRAIANKQSLYETQTTLPRTGSRIWPTCA